MEKVTRERLEKLALEVLQADQLVQSLGMSNSFGLDPAARVSFDIAWAEANQKQAQSRDVYNATLEAFLRD